MKFCLTGILLLIISSTCFSVTKDDLKGVTIKAESSTVSLQDGTIRYEKPVITTKDGKVYKADYLEHNWQNNKLIELISHGNPITYVDSEAKNNELAEGQAESLSYKAKDNTAVLKNYSLKDAQGNILRSKAGRFILEEQLITLPLPDHFYFPVYSRGRYYSSPVQTILYKSLRRSR